MDVFSVFFISMVLTGLIGLNMINRWLSSPVAPASPAPQMTLRQPMIRNPQVTSLISRHHTRRAANDPWQHQPSPWPQAS